MEYHSPLGYNFNLGESIAKHDEKHRGSEKKPQFPNAVPLKADCSSRKPFPFENTQKSRARHSNYDKSPRYGSDDSGKCKRALQDNWNEQRNHSEIFVAIFDDLSQGLTLKRFITDGNHFTTCCEHTIIHHGYKTGSISIAEYYHPTMMEDPWKEFE